MADISPSIMETDDKLVYLLHVGSVEMNAWVDGLQDGIPGDVYVEIRQDRRAVRATRKVKQSRLMSWDEEFLMVGNGSSIVSLSLVQDDYGSTPRGLSVACVDVVIGTLLVPCAGGQFASLEMPPGVLERKSGMMRTMALKIIQQGHVNDVAIHKDKAGESYLHCFEESGDVADLQTAITNMSLAAELTDDAHPSKAIRLISLGDCQETLFQELGNLSDLESAISNYEKAIELTPDGHTDLPLYLSNLGYSQHIHFKQLNNWSDLEKAISNHEKAVELTVDGHPNQAQRLVNLGTSQYTLFERLGNLSDLENAISKYEKAVKTTADGHPDLPTYLSDLGDVQRARFEQLSDLSDLQNAISNYEKAIEITVDGHPDRHIYLAELGVAQHDCFMQLGNLADLEDAISNCEKAVELTPDGHEDQAMHLSNLGDSQHTCFEQLGNLSDLQNAIANYEKAIEIMPEGHPDQPMHLSTLGMFQQAHFDQLGNVSDLKNAISNHEKAVKLTPDGHPDYPTYLSNLSTSQQAWFDRFGNPSDLENAISNSKRVVKLTLDGHPDQPNHLSCLGTSQQALFERFGNLSDLEDAISNHKKAVELTPNGHPNQPTCLSNLGISQQTQFEQLGNLSDLKNAISNHEKAVKLTPDGRPDLPIYLSNLGASQQALFEKLGNLSDLENAISNYEKAVGLTSDGHQDEPLYLSNLGTSQQIRFERLGDWSDFENAISHYEKAVKLTPDCHPSKTQRLSKLGVAHQIQFEQLSNLSDLENAISNHKKVVELTPDGHPDQPRYLSNLGASQQTCFEHIGDLFNLENAISNYEKAIELTSDGHPDQPLYLSNLATSQYALFEHCGKLSILKNAVSNTQKAVALTDDSDPRKSWRLLLLGHTLQGQFQYLGDFNDLAASVLCYQAAAQLEAAYPSEALRAARKWAETWHVSGNLLPALDGYRTALDLLPKVAWLGLNTPSRQDQLLRAKSENLGCLAANCAIQLGQLEEAVELLDLGRSVFWQQASSLRSDLQKLRENTPELAEELERVGHLLDTGNFVDAAFTAGRHGVKVGQHNIENIGKERRRLVAKWEGLVERVRQLPQFEYFLRPIPFHQLRQASSGGQVIIINVSQFGVDALIFGTSGPIEHVPLPDIDLEMLARLSDDIVLEQPTGASAIQRRAYTTHFLKPAMRMIWNYIVVNIFNKIDIPLVSSVIPPQHRIWWYLTGPLTFVPIHAAGPGSRITDVSRLVISSYVTTLGSLFEAKARHNQPCKGNLKFLSVSQPETPGETALPQTKEEVKRVDQAFRSSGWSEGDIHCLWGSDATVDRVLDALDSCTWVHFACHAFQDSKLGMKSAFALYDSHLELGHIASKNLSDGQFAFLSACSAAAGMQNLPGEAMHLAAGLQFVGFPSVIATMWSIRDDDAPRVAEDVYQYLFRNGLQKIDPSEAATALNHALLHLREDPSITLDQWAPFIHIGI